MLIFMYLDQVGGIIEGASHGCVEHIDQFPTLLVEYGIHLAACPAAPFNDKVFAKEAILFFTPLKFHIAVDVFDFR